MFRSVRVARVGAAVGTSIALLAARSPAAEPEKGAVQKSAKEPECVETTEKQHVVGGLYEHSEAIGLRYQHTHFSAAGCGEGFLMWGGYGVDLRLLESDLKRIDGGLAQLSGRFGTFPGAGVGVGAEVGAGAGPTRDGFRGLGFVGAFATFYYLDLGAAYFFPLGPFDRPKWLNDIVFAMRIHVPVVTYDEHVRRYSK